MATPAPSLSSLFPVHSYGQTPVVILDGGMGTSLQAPPFSLSLDSDLWSSELLATPQGRESLERLHHAWITESGAQVVESCTYQSSLPLFLPREGPYTPSQTSSALSVMTSALPLLTSLTRSPSDPSSDERPIAALSLGPFGAALQPGQEYSGLYPPPFGPASPPAKPSPSRLAAGEPAIAAAGPLPLELFAPKTASDAAANDEAHLAAWHLQRLEHFATAPAFSALGVLAFETIPNLSEARAIRRAVAAFRARGGPERQMPFFISFVFPLVAAGPAGEGKGEGQGQGQEEVKLPDQTLSHLSLAEQAPLIVSSAFGSLVHDDDDDDDEAGAAAARPDGIGFNCTSPLRAAEVVETLSSALASFSFSRPQSSGSSKPWLVLYPDGGAVYDVHTRSWSHPLGLSDSGWAKVVADAAGVARERDAVWGGVIAGGCCKAGFGAIRALRDECEARGWTRRRE
ncbi:hypothetical protein JCM1840_001185 [Sporobolomyces johnsonii]